MNRIVSMDGRSFQTASGQERISEATGHTASINELDFHYVVEILRKFKWFIVLVTTLIVASTAYYVDTLVPVYRSTATLLVEPQNVNSVSIEEIYDVDDTNSEYYQTQIELLRSRELARNTIEALNLWEHEELQGVVSKAPEDTASAPNSAEGPTTFLSAVKRITTSFIVFIAEKYQTASEKIRQLVSTQSPVPSEVAEADRIEVDRLDLRDAQLRAMRNFTSRVVVEPVRKTKLIKVSYESADPELAALVANEIVQQYIESYLSSKSEVTSKVSQWLSRRLTELKSTLDDSEGRLRGFKRDNGLVDVDGRVGRLNEQELLLLTNELSQARSQLSSTEDLFRELQELKNFPDALDGLAAVQADPLIQRTKIEKGMAIRSLDELLNRYGVKHPAVIDAQSQVDSLYQALADNIERIVVSTGKDFKLLQQRVESIESKLASGKQEIQEIGSKKFQLDVLEREVATNQKLYDIFFSRYTESRSANGLEEANASVAESAVPAPSPIRPRKTLLTAMAALGALVLTILLSFLFDRLDNTVKGSKDVEKKLGLRLIGVLPLVKHGVFSSNRGMPLSPIGNADKAGRFAESINAARTSLCIDKRSSDYKLILITSSVPGEGKTTSSVNLAYSFGQQERVLLIDGDMRRPSVGKTLGLKSNAPGLSDLISETARTMDCIRRGVLNGAFDVMPAGHVPDHPLELLTNLRFEKILSDLSEFYDRIIIDSAPVHAVSDALVFSKFADAVVYIIKSNSTPINIVKQGLARLEQAEANLVGGLVTQADMEKLKSYGAAIHYGGYYDNYGYSEERESYERQPKRRRVTDTSDWKKEMDEYTRSLNNGKSSIRSIGAEFKSKRPHIQEPDYSLELDYTD